MFSYLKGTTEEEIRQSAEELGKFTKGSQVPPLANPEGEITQKGAFELTGKVDEARAMKKFVDALKKIDE